ncbi:hypothetical protein [Microbulbifer agarilyticus]
MKKFILVFLFSVTASAAELETENYLIEIDSACEAGDEGCDKATYNGTNKKSGATIRLKGRMLHRMCADGVTHCQILGYEFKSGNITYYVSHKGLLEVVRGQNEVLVREQGEWRK